jgi:hypothetical protein
MIFVSVMVYDVSRDTMYQMFYIMVSNVHIMFSDASDVSVMSYDISSLLMS